MYGATCGAFPHRKRPSLAQLAWYPVSFVSAHCKTRNPGTAVSFELLTVTGPFSHTFSGICVYSMYGATWGAFPHRKRQSLAHLAGYLVYFWSARSETRTQ